MAASDAPVEIGRVTLAVKDLAAMSDFYRSSMGLEEISRDGTSVLLGVGDKVLMDLHGDKAARIGNPRAAGLFHTAFLLPSRGDLGAFLRHVADLGLALDGAADHGVSEALYMRDPEGNGIEIYFDRPRSEWPRKGQRVAMVTERLDLNDLARSAPRPWAGAPAGSVVGHVHLQVGDLASAETFVTGPIGMDVTQQMPGATFYSSGGYHHHLASNIWNSNGMAGRAEGTTGLEAVELLLDRELFDAAGAHELQSPWGTKFNLTAKTA
ncbi:VOC family protein [Paracoccus sp. (in: a-proteobacteria)]|uniref:VOC family protein n=1 Tax=Paracoccus sp. TaxID=267 RepID=UPI00289E79A9|nr:VOC family protein [Paracoccus sp. (in: a-proteobacteria)]